MPAGLEKKCLGRGKMKCRRARCEQRWPKSNWVGRASFFFTRFCSTVLLQHPFRAAACATNVCRAWIPGLYDDSGASEVDVEAAAADSSFGERKFYIDPKGDGSFTTATARCFKAVIHRYINIWCKNNPPARSYRRYIQYVTFVVRSLRTAQRLIPCTPAPMRN